jgi:prephenate dehydrogenase
MSELPRHVTIAGFGLMGGSLARALARLGAPPAVYVVDSDPAALAAAANAGITRQTYGSLSDAPAADLLVLAMPVSGIVATLRAGGTVLARYAVITDVGSVKVAPLRAAAAGGVADRYAGSHPLCGDHRGGFSASRADLYTRCTVYVMRDAAPSARALVSAVWHAAGATVVTLDAAAHDTLVAQTSHLPQITASVLAATLADGGTGMHELGPGGRDTTRIAASDALLWTDILMHNRAVLADPLARLEANVHALRHALGTGDAGAVHALLSRASAWRSAAQ